MDAWGRLWDIATANKDGLARIEIDGANSGRVILVWQDGSRGEWYWDDGDWQPANEE